MGGHWQVFALWQGRRDTIIAKFPGYVSSDMMPGPDGGNEWTIVLNFRTPEQLEVWQKSSERAAIIAESIPFLEGGNFGDAVRTDGTGEQPGTSVTEVILSKIKPGMDDAYRAWTVKIQAAQARYPGYRGTYLQPPSSNDSHWTTLLRYDTAEHLERSEEHTSELQSHLNLVCRLLLEKKKNKNNKKYTTQNYTSETITCRY